MAWPSQVSGAVAHRSERQAVFAGRFYPGDADACQQAAQQYVQTAAAEVGPSLPAQWIGGIVPHAGWVCSAAIAARSMAALAQSAADADVVVIFAAIHTPMPTPTVGILDDYARWVLPSATCTAAQVLRQTLLERAPAVVGIDDRFHEREHAVEVELPLLASAWPKATILPVEVAVNQQAVELGRDTARAIQQHKLKAVYLASSDLTHYGPAYRFTPAGIGIQGLNWAKDNDRRLIDVVQQLDPLAVIPEVKQHRNACGGGAIAAMLAACREHGAKSARLLQHASSFETLATVAPQPPVDAVGYAAVVVG